MSLVMSFHSKLIGQLFARKSGHLSLSPGSNVFLRNFHISKLISNSLKNGSFSSSTFGFLQLAKQSSLPLSATFGSRNISIITPIISKTKSVLRKIQFYATSFIVAFVAVYAFISFSLSTVVYELLKMQANSISIKDKSLDVEKKEN